MQESDFEMANLCYKKIHNTVVMNNYCMAVSHKDWEVPNSRI